MGSGGDLSVVRTEIEGSGIGSDEIGAVCNCSGSGVCKVWFRLPLVRRVTATGDVGID